jgi:DNA-binding response OmpR family regulator
MSDLSRCTVLIVDDSEENMDILVATLGEEVDVTVAMDGESALEAVADETPDLILLDIEMPGMDGFDVCRRLKADSATAWVPIVFLSGLTDPEDKTRGLTLGGVDFIHKPFVAREVLAKVRDILIAGPCARKDSAS